jgi:hypothetical protein
MNESKPIKYVTSNDAKGHLPTTIAIDHVKDMSLHLINDDIHILPYETLIKFVNLSKDSNSMNFIINHDLLFDSINYEGVTEYISLKPATNYNVIITDYQTRTLILDVQNILLLPGKAYTFYVIGLMTSTPQIQLVTALDGSSYFLD